MSNLDTFGILPAIRAGLGDTFSPGSMVGVLIFFVFLFLLLRKKREIGWFGINFIAGVIFVTLLMNLGAFDPLIRSQAYDILLDIGYFIFAIMAIGTGVILLRDWWMFRKHGSLRKSIIKYHFLDDFPLVNPPKEILLVYFASFCCGGVVAFLESAWPSNIFVGFILYLMSMPGKVWSAMTLLLIYALTFVLPLVVVLVAMRWVVSKPPIIAKLKKSVSKIQVISSAVFMAFGFVLLSYYF